MPAEFWVVSAERVREGAAGACWAETRQGCWETPRPQGPQPLERRARSHSSVVQRSGNTGPRCRETQMNPCPQGPRGIPARERMPMTAVETELSGRMRVGQGGTQRLISTQEKLHRKGNGLCGSHDKP